MPDVQEELERQMESWPLESWPPTEPPEKPELPPKDEGGPPKKAQEPLPEDAMVPAKRTRITNPLKKKSKIQRITRIEEINPPTVSKGEEAIAFIENEEKAKAKESIGQDAVGAEKPKESPSAPTEEPEERPTPYLQGGVEVLDAKKKKLRLKVDKFGIPIRPGEHRNFDRI